MFGIYWLYIGDMLGIFWDILQILWRCFGDILGIFWGFRRHVQARSCNLQFRAELLGASVVLVFLIAIRV